MMIRFWLIVFSTLAVVSALSAEALGAVLPHHMTGRGRALILTVNVLSMLLFAAGMKWHHLIPEEIRRVAVIVLSMLWMSELIFVIAVFSARIIRWIYRLFSPPPLVFDPERRHLLARAAAYPALAAAAGVYGGTLGRTRVAINEYDVPVDGLGAELDGFRVAQISDVHLGLFFSLDDFRQLLEKAASTGADALAVTGDLFDDDDMNEEAAKILDGFVPRFPRGIWFCYGNHEYFRNLPKIEAALSRTRVHVLRDSGEQAADGVRPLWFVGVDYPRSHSVFKVEGAASMRRAMDGVPEDAVVILLAHHPDFIDDAAARDVTLALTGHTHGGQFGLFGIALVPPVFRYMRGVYRVGSTFGYVHSGNGSWFPFRLGCPPEIAVFRLIRV